MTKEEKQRFIEEQLRKLNDGVTDEHATILTAILRLHADVEEVKRKLADLEFHRQLWGR
jgi:hypothetical protein